MSNAFPVLYRIHNRELVALFPQPPVGAWWTISDSLFMPGLITPPEYRASRPATEAESADLRHRLETVFLRPELDLSLRSMMRFPRADISQFAPEIRH